jgi:hypothetical protein
MAKCITVRDPNRTSRGGFFTSLEMALYKTAKENNYAPLYSYYSNDKTHNGITTATLKMAIDIKPGDVIYLRLNNMIMARGVAKAVEVESSPSVLTQNLSDIVNDSKNYSGRSMMRADSCMTSLDNRGTNNRRANWVMIFDDAQCFLNSRPKTEEWGQHIYVEKWEEFDIPKLVNESMFEDKNSRCSIRELKREVTENF